jgi:hypothetical protein
MGLVTVRVYAVDENTDPLEGVLVQVYDDSDVFVTQNVTALVAGEAYAEFTLNGELAGEAYSIRLQKLGVAFDGLLGDDSKTPQSITVYDPPGGAPVTGTNFFQVQGQTFTRPASTNPRLCKASGFFRDVAGRPLADVSIRFINLNCPLIVDGDAVAGDKVWGRTDEDGYFECELYRDGQYRASIENYDIQLRTIVVPDASSVNLPDLLFPIVVSTVYDPDPIAVTVDGSVDVEVTYTDSTGVERTDLDEGDLIFTIDDETIASGQIVDGKLRITGVAAGSTTVIAERADTSITKLPEPTFTAVTINVT